MLYSKGNRDLVKTNGKLATYRHVNSVGYHGLTARDGDQLRNTYNEYGTIFTLYLKKPTTHISIFILKLARG